MFNVEIWVDKGKETKIHQIEYIIDDFKSNPFITVCAV